MSIEKLIAGLAARIETDTASILLRRSLTLDGRITYEDALVSLSPAERYIVERLENREHRLSASAGNISLAFRPHGRLYLLPHEEFDTQDEALTLLGHAELDADDLQKFHLLRQSAQHELEQERTAICAYLHAQGFEQICNELSTLSEHMAPLIYYVGKRCISNFYNIGKSKFAPEITLSEALQQVAEQQEQAGIELLTVTYCLHLLLRSGSYTRAEELNSTQLSLPALSAFFDAKHMFYQEVCDCPAQPADRFNLASLTEKAALLAVMRETVATTHRFIRHINGMNLRKKEAVLPLSPSYTNAVLAPITRSAHALATLQRWLPAGSSAQQLFKPGQFEKLLGKILLTEESGAFNSYFEYLIDRVVAEAVRSTRSDIGMTRSARNFRRFSAALHGRETDAVCEWSQAEYFCHVVPSTAMLEECSPKGLAMTLNAISARMRYNSWHYAPSYFDTGSITTGRGWFYAPRMADIADWSDQHHAGHTHAAVRYSIRSPLPLCRGNEVLPGFIDLRLMRQSGDPYSREDLVTAIAYTEVLQFLYQHLMNHVLEQDEQFVISFGDKKWFDKVYPMQTAIA